MYKLSMLLINTNFKKNNNEIQIHNFFYSNRDVLLIQHH
jgi:hypothetical protein